MSKKKIKGFISEDEVRPACICGIIAILSLFALAFSGTTNPVVWIVVCIFSFISLLGLCFVASSQSDYFEMEEQNKNPFRKED